jgi:hypothetical protein
MDIDAKIHQKLAVTLNGEVWSLLAKQGRGEDDARRMVHAAHASHYHWLHAGNEVNEQRGEWLIAHVYSVLGLGEAALRHAERCAELTAKLQDQLKDFDLAYSAEALARAHAVLGDGDRASEHKARARELGDKIAEPEDKKIFDGDFAAGDWHGVA